MKEGEDGIEAEEALEFSELFSDTWILGLPVLIAAKFGEIPTSCQ